VTKIVDVLPLVTEDQRAAILAAPRTAEAHGDLLASVPAMNLLEVGGKGGATVLPASFGVAAWNVERCLFPQASADHLLPHNLGVVLLSEMDKGMARTGQKNTTAELAAAMGMHYVYGVEFYELDLGGPTERPYCTDDFNAAGWHGNGILSSVPFTRVQMLRLDERGHWFLTGEDGGSGDPDQPRMGGRMAILAELPTESGPICVVSTHLESATGTELRHAQFEMILDAVEEFAPGMPVLIGGDLNTGNHLPPDYDHRKETLFAMAEERGYAWDLTAEGVTTRNSLITPHDTRRMKLDWFCHRGLTGASRPLLASLDPEERPLSDHECILCDVTLG
jgi:endonuclease/exonuclease/phosphatase family metal-dependent hydrolase